MFRRCDFANSGVMYQAIVNNLKVRPGAAEIWTTSFGSEIGYGRVLAKVDSEAAGDISSDSLSS